MANKKQDSFEKNLSMLETLVGRLEQGELPLEQALKEFAQGIKLARQCQQELQAAEQKIEILMHKPDSAEPQPYTADTGDKDPDD
jgi:exodeoxyribonuclease VII small subunit